MHNETYDRFTDLSLLCGIDAFRLPPRRPFTGDRRDRDTNTDLFGPIPDHLLSQYLCYDRSPPPIAAAASTSLELHSLPPLNYKDSINMPHSSEPLLVDSPSKCPNFTKAQTPPSPQAFIHDSPVKALDFTLPVTISRSPPASDPRQEREILPLCVVNFQDSLHLTSEGERRPFSATSGIEESDGEKGIANLRCYEIKELSSCDPSDVLEECGIEESVPVTKNHAFSGGHAERLLSRIKRFAFRCKDASLDDSEFKNMVSLVSSFREFAFSSTGRTDSWYGLALQEPSRKTRRNREAKSKGVGSSCYFTRSKTRSDR